jgi:hypothetical protein
MLLSSFWINIWEEMAVTITWVKARQIFISRGNPTVEVRHFALPSLPGAVNLVLPLFSFCLDQRLSPTLLEIGSSSVCLCPSSARRCAQDLLTSGFVFYVGSGLTVLCGCAQVDVGLRDGSYARGAVPSGVSTGTSVCSMPPSPFTPRFCFSSAPVPEPLLGFIDLVSLIWACRGIWAVGLVDRSSSSW